MTLHPREPRCLSQTISQEHRLSYYTHAHTAPPNMQHSTHLRKKAAPCMTYDIHGPTHIQSHKIPDTQHTHTYRLHVATDTCEYRSTNIPKSDTHKADADMDTHPSAHITDTHSPPTIQGNLSQPTLPPAPQGALSLLFPPAWHLPPPGSPPACLSDITPHLSLPSTPPAVGTQWLWYLQQLWLCMQQFSN